MSRQFLEPFNHCVLTPRLLHRGPHRTATNDEHDEGDSNQNRRGKAQQEWVIEGQDPKADDRTKNKVDTGEQKHRPTLLKCDDVEEAVHKLRDVRSVR